MPQHGPKYEHKSVPFDATTTNQVWVNTATYPFVVLSLLPPSADTVMGLHSSKTSRVDPSGMLKLAA